MLKKQYLFSFVLALLSVVAAHSIEEIGIKNYYHQKATNFLKESGYFDLAHVDDCTPLPMGNAPFLHFSLLDSLNFACLQANQENVVLYNTASNSIGAGLNIDLLSKIRDVVVVDSSLILFDENMAVYRSYAPFDSLHTEKVMEGVNFVKSAAVCHHPLTHRLFIVGDVLESDNPTTERSVYTINLNKRNYNELPLFTFDVADLELFAEANHIKINSFKIDENGDSIPGLTFLPTAIAVHPKTNEIYLLSSVDKSMAVFNQFGELVNFAFLSDRHFTYPTAMTFNSKGDLFISNNDLLNNSILKINWNKLVQRKDTNSLIFGL